MTKATKVCDPAQPGNRLCLPSSLHFSNTFLKNISSTMHSIDNAFFNRFLKHVPSTVHSVHIPSTPNTVFNAFLTTCVLCSSCSSLCDGRFARSPLLRGRVESVVLLHGRRRDRRFAAGVRGARVHDGQVMPRCVCPCVDVGCGLWELWWELCSGCAYDCASCLSLLV